MTKQQIEDLAIGFDEYGFEPTILCDIESVVRHYQNAFKEILKDYERLYEIENANPSEVLECLEEIKKVILGYVSNGDYDYDNVVVPNFTTIKQALLTKSKKEQAFDIIKEKCVDVGYVIMSFVYKDYNSKMNELWGDKAPSYYLTEQEFNLLKEVL